MQPFQDTYLTNIKAKLKVPKVILVTSLFSFKTDYIWTIAFVHRKEYRKFHNYFINITYENSHIFNTVNCADVYSQQMVYFMCVYQYYLQIFMSPYVNLHIKNGINDREIIVCAYTYCINHQIIYFSCQFKIKIKKAMAQPKRP